MAKQLIAAAAVVGLLLIAYVFLTEPAPVKEPGETWHLATLDQFDRIDLTRGDLHLVVEKGTAGWRIREPLAFTADSDQMEQVERLFGDEERRLLVDNEKDASPANLNGYGFDDNASVLEVTLYNAGEAAATFQIANTEASDTGATRTWLRPDGADSIYRVNRDLRRTLDRDLAAWRDADVMVLTREQQDQLTAVTVSYGERELRFERQGEDEWAMASPEDIETDPTLVSRYVRRVDTLRSTDFADDVTPEEAGLTDPEHTVVLELGEGERYTLRFGTAFTVEQEAEDNEETEPAEPEERRYVQLDDGPVFQITARVAEEFMKRIGDFRPREVLSLDQDQIVRVELAEHEAPPLVLVRNPPEALDEGETDEIAEEATWSVEEPEAIAEVDMTEMRRILSNVAEVEANRFVDEELDAQGAGLVIPRRVIRVTLADDTEHVIELGAPSPPWNEGDPEEQADRYARVDGGLIFQMRSHKARHLLKTLEDLRPDEEEG